MKIDAFLKGQLFMLSHSPTAAGGISCPKAYFNKKYLLADCSYAIASIVTFTHNFNKHLLN